MDAVTVGGLTTGALTKLASMMPRRDGRGNFDALMSKDYRLATLQ